MGAMIETEGLTRVFNSTTAVEDLTLSIREGEVFGFLGPNGAGKTTTVRMLCTLIAKTRGMAHVNGLDISDPDEAMKIRQIVGLLPEMPGLYERLSAYRNLDFYGRLYGLDETKRRESIERFLKLLDLWEKREDSVATFSKGMRQKIVIARALIHDPLVLFLDEPTAGLDPEAAKTVRDFILELRKERRTIFLNTHNLDEAGRVCDRIGIIRTKLIAVGTPNELSDKLWKKNTVVNLVALEDHVVEAVKRLDLVQNVRTSNNSLICEVDNPEEANPYIVEAIVKAGGRVRSVVELQRSLEEVYLKLIKEEPSG